MRVDPRVVQVGDWLQIPGQGIDKVVEVDWPFVTGSESMRPVEVTGQPDRLVEASEDQGGVFTFVTHPCVLCGGASMIDVPTRAVAAWRAGWHWQAAWKQATPQVRELLISGTHPGCWDKIMEEVEQ